MRPLVHTVWLEEREAQLPVLMAISQWLRNGWLPSGHACCTTQDPNCTKNPARPYSCQLLKLPDISAPALQWNSASETRCTLDFGKRVTEVTLGAAKKNTESGAAHEAKELVSRNVYSHSPCPHLSMRLLKAEVAPGLGHVSMAGITRYKQAARWKTFC